MTPEERFTKIENAIQALAETQARHEAQLEKQNAGIRDLIVVSRTLLDSHQATVDSHQGLVAAQRATDEKLNVLIDNVNKLSAAVNKLVQGLQKPNGNA